MSSELNKVEVERCNELWKKETKAYNEMSNFERFVVGNTDELWEMNGEFLESKYINEVESVEEIGYGKWLVKMDGRYCRLSYM